VPTYRRTDTGKIIVKFQINGVTYRQSVPEATSIAEGKVVEAQLKKDIFDGKYGGQRDIDFKDFVERYFKPWWSGNFRSDPTYVLSMFCRAFPGPIREVSQLKIEAWKKKRAATNTFMGSPPHLATVQNELALLSSVFELACDNDFLSKNPMRKVRRYTQAQIVCKRDRILSPDEQEKLEAVLLKRGEVFWGYMIGRHAGMRLMEILELRKETVNLQTWEIHILKSKNGQPRVLPILEALKPIFQAMPLTRDGFYFSRRTGCSYHGKGSAWKEACEEVGIEDFRFHDLRHTFASALPPDPYLRAAWLGHSKIETSFIYSHTSIEQMRQAAEGGKVLVFEKSVSDTSRRVVKV
jgi:integrase